MPDLITRLNAALEGRYRIEREIGQGGMATVYVAEDLRHDRNVALKVLTPELAAIVGAERFLSEIRTTAALQHPHILPLHDSGEADGLLFFVTPYVEGESLRRRLDREKQLAANEAVRIAREVADALDYAHRQGVVHRDIKPGNILLKEGRALVADFGIALAVGAGGGDRLTETGLSLGTPNYMSPEQATGDQHVGPPTDIYALGCVLYEMLAGEPPYAGSTAQAILGKIITGTPDSLIERRPSVPPNVDAAVRRALEKVPADRFSVARDFAEALADSGFRHGPQVAVGAAGGTRLWKALAIAACGLAVASMATLFSVSVASNRSPLGNHFELVLPANLSVARNPFHSVDVSPDGSTIVFAGVSGEGQIGLWLKPATELRPRTVEGTENGQGPRFSPDGQLIAFLQEGDLRVAGVGGGSPRTVLAEAYRGIGFSGLAWGPDGKIYVSRGAAGVWRVGVDGEEVEQVVAPQADDGVQYHWPEVLPNGEAVLFTSGTVATRGDAEIQVVSLENGEVTTLARGYMARYAPTGHLVYVTADGTLLAAGFDTDRLQMGPARTMPERVEVRGSMAAYFALSRTGTLVYLPVVPPPSVELVWVTRTGEATPVDPDWRFVPGGAIWGLDLAPLGDRVAVSARVDDNTDIWIKHLPDGSFERVTFDVEAEGYPAWSPDGRFLTYWRSGPEAALWRSRADSTATPEALLRGGAVLLEGNGSPDGDWIVGRTPGQGLPPNEQRDIVAFRPGSDAAPLPLVADPDVDEQNPTLSPDGRWLAYSSSEDGQFNVYVSPFPEVESGRVRISTNGGIHPLWARSGRELFFWDFNINAVVAAAVATDPQFTVLRRQTLFPIDPGYEWGAGSSRIWAITPDDQRFLMARSAGAGEPPRLVVDQNFGSRLEQELERR